ncbi:uncharacterized membrane protein YuiD-like [Zingiber officinale]|uniref:Acid phosphatase/vanadium-dependent haloperoxidase-related protein n=1 Tax=Zingiber officinale TaxID=94328 RepID=A0A8J5F9T5_ZINOF|nr:uncharacterized membrane protein YuiD-like [Zingiber officinale]KAG6481898.1 hypothetical protein ZIOFF_058521 [Zingiber officinale]
MESPTRHVRFASLFPSSSSSFPLRDQSLTKSAAAASISPVAMRKLEEAASPSSSSATFFLSQGSALVSAVLAFAIAQSAKIFTTWYNERRWDPKRIIGSGGMPSSHSATVVALAVAIGIHDGWGSSAFATATILAAVVICDASGVRLHAGKQAEVLNQLLYELPEGHPLYDSRPLRELLGHTPLQVAAGAVLGCVVAVVAQLVHRLATSAWQTELIDTLVAID